MATRRKKMARPVRKPVSRSSAARRSRKTRRKPKKVGRWILLVAVLGWLLLKVLPDLLPSSQDPAVTDHADTGTGQTSSESAASQDERAAEVLEIETPDANTDNSHWWDIKPLLRKVFIVSKVDIRAGETVPEDSIRLWLGDVEGIPMIDLPIKSIAERLQQHPRIRRAVVSVQVPRTLSIRIEERTEIALLVMGTDLVGLDREGVVLPLPQVVQPLDIPLITGFRGTLSSGDTLSANDLQTAFRWVLEASRRPRVADWLSEVHIHSGGIELVGGIGGCRVLPGGHSIDLQMAALNEFLHRRGPVTEPGWEMDLTFEEYLILRPANGGSRSDRSSS